ncbi:hypothetical protein AAC978_05470 [Desulfitobacterium sp. THU1]|uniref:hypothetical protein n=1 Tax=Desulfitobacterium sp. THU1 TaxID=3138072 RepID=UPI00311EFC0B
MNVENDNKNEMTITTKTDMQSVSNNIGLELNVKPNQYEKDDLVKMPFGMVP